MYCTYCEGKVVWSGELGYHVHATDGERIPEAEITPGDFVSRNHNRAGSRVNPADIADDNE